MPEIVGEIQEKPDAICEQLDSLRDILPASLPDPHPSLADISPEKPCIPYNLPSYFPYPVNCLLPASLRNVNRRTVFFEPCKVLLGKPVAPFTLFVLGKPVGSILRTRQADFSLVARPCGFLMDFWG